MKSFIIMVIIYLLVCFAYIGISFSCSAETIYIYDRYGNLVEVIQKENQPVYVNPPVIVQEPVVEFPWFLFGCCREHYRRR